MWFVFIAMVVGLLVLDLGVFHRKAHVISVRESLAWTAVWIGVALLFNILIFFTYEHHWLGANLEPGEPDGWNAAFLFFAGYLVEKSLSVDNLFVIAMIFSMFAVPPRQQHRVLFWGILGALAMRGIMVLVGAALLQRFHWVLYIFGALLVATALKMLFTNSEHGDPRSNWFVRLARRFFPIADDDSADPDSAGHDVAGSESERFIVRVGGTLMLTPLALALVAVESTDPIFAVDSIPAIFAITDDPFLVFSSNVFALLGMRSLYFAITGVMDQFYYLKPTLCVLLAFIGVKMLLKDVLHGLPGLTYYTLGAIVLILAVGAAASLIRARREAARIERGG